MRDIIKIKSNLKAQASIEMAIFGSLILAAMVSLFSYSQRLNDEQYLTMEAFRGALREARRVKGTAQYVSLDHRRYVSGDFFRKGSRTAVYGSGMVFWGKPDMWPVRNNDSIEIDILRNTGEKTVWKINGIEYDIDGQIANQIFSEAFTQEMQKREDTKRIATTHTVEIIQDGATIEFDNGTTETQDFMTIEPQNTNRSYTWTTPHPRK